MQGTTVGLLLRSTQALCGQLCEKQTLDYGIAYYSEPFADLAEANQFREVVIENPALMPEALAQTQRCFQEKGLRCDRWAPAVDQPIEPLSSFLIDSGFHECRFTAMTLTRWVEWEADPCVRVLPARAMRTAYRATFIEADSPRSSKARKSLADAYEQRLDDPPFDAFVAMVSGQPAGRCTLFQIGDIARVMDLVVRPAFASRGVDRALLAHVLTLAKRLTMRHICLQVPIKQRTRRDWLETAGFAADGEIVEFERDPADQTAVEP